MSVLSLYFCTKSPGVLIMQPLKATFKSHPAAWRRINPHFDHTGSTKQLFVTFSLFKNVVLMQLYARIRKHAYMNHENV